MKSRISAVILGLGVMAAGASWLVSEPVVAKSAPPLSRLEILKIVSPACGVEDVSDGRSETKCDHGGGPIQVHVLELGIGRMPIVTLDGFEVDGTRAPVCQNVTSLVACTGGGITVGYLYSFTLNDKQEGTFSFTNTSINAPGNRMSAQIYIR